LENEKYTDGEIENICNAYGIKFSSYLFNYSSDEIITVLDTNYNITQLKKALLSTGIPLLEKRLQEYITDRE